MRSATFFTKSFFAGVAAIVTGIGLIVSGSVEDGIMTIAGGVSVIVLRDGITKVEGKR